MAILKRENVKYFCVHCSASRWGDANAIDDWHKSRGWSGIGYNTVILNGYRDSSMRYNPKLDGKIEPGRPENQVGAHCAAGGMNFKSLSVCLIGIPGVDKYPTDAQYGALIHHLATKCIQYNRNPLTAVTQHGVWDKKKPFCASINLIILKARVVLKIREMKKQSKL